MAKDEVQRNLMDGYRPSMLYIEDPLQPGWSARWNGEELFEWPSTLTDSLPRLQQITTLAGVPMVLCKWSRPLTTPTWCSATLCRPSQSSTPTTSRRGKKGPTTHVSVPNIVALLHHFQYCKTLHQFNDKSRPLWSKCQFLHCDAALFHTKTANTTQRGVAQFPAPRHKKPDWGLMQHLIWFECWLNYELLITTGVVTPLSSAAYSAE